MEEKRRKSYQSDLTDEQWEEIAPLYGDNHIDKLLQLFYSSLMMLSLMVTNHCSNYNFPWVCHCRNYLLVSSPGVSWLT